MFGKASYWKNEFYSAVLRYGIESLPARFTRSRLYKFASKKKYESAVKYAEILEAYRYITKHSKKANKLIQSFYSHMMYQIKVHIPDENAQISKQL